MTTPLKGTRTKRGILTKAQRLALTETLAADILKVYRGLGGAKWLLEWAKDNPTEFMKQGLARLLPPMPKDLNDDAPLVALNFNGDPTEAARRIAFALAKGANELGQDDPVADRVPYVQIAREEDPFHYPSAPDPERERWIKEASLTPEERLNAETLDEHVNRRAFADSPPRPAWMPQEERPARTPVRLRSKRDLL